MAKVLGLKQLLQKKFNYLDGLSDEMKSSFGNLVKAFIMIVWGGSGNGKSNFLMKIIHALMPFGKVLYVSLEEGTEASIVQTVMRHLSLEDHSGKIEFADHYMTYESLMIKLKKKQSPQFVIIDSVQYWNISYEQYKTLKEAFPRKAFIFISHASGKLPDGRTADKIRYDAGIKVHVEGYVAKVISRYGGNKPYVIWEEGAKKYWGKQYRSVITGVKDQKEKKAAKEKPAEEQQGAVTHVQIAEEQIPIFKESVNQ